MAKNTGKKKKQKTESVSESLYYFFGSLTDVVISIYMALILIVMPLYHEEGFKHIGTDKAMFFRRAAVICGGFLVPVLILFGIFKLTLYLQKQKAARKAVGAAKMGAIETLKKILSAAWGGLKNGMSSTDYFVLMYGVGVVLSYACSHYKEEAFWGTTGWYMGMIPQLILVISYFMISKVWVRKNRLIMMILPVSAIVFVLGYLNRFGIYPIDMLVENVSFISTIGNINWYCGYLTTVFFGGVFLLWKKEGEKSWQKLLLMGYVLIGFATLVTHGSSSGLLALAAVVLVLFVLSAADGRRMEAFWLEMCLLSAACLITYLLRRFGILTITLQEGSVELFTGSAFSLLMTVVSAIGYIGVKGCNIKTCYPGKAVKVIAGVICAGVAVVFAAYVVVLVLNTGSEGALLASTVLSENPMFIFSNWWGSRRGLTWRVGLQIFLEQTPLHQLFGVGPDCMAAYFYTDGNPDLVTKVNQYFKEARLTNAHNEWLTILINMGLLGLISYAGIMISAVKRYIGGREHSPVAGACGLCVLAYTVNNMFSFQQSMGVSTLFIILAVGENYLRGKKQ